MPERTQTEYLQNDKFAGRRQSAAVTEMPNRTQEDARLMTRICQNADKAALQEIAQHYGPRLKSFLMFRGEQAETAEDIVQDVIIQTWLKAQKFDPARGAFSAWIYRMTRNKWIDHKRKQGRLLPTEPNIMSTLADDWVDGADQQFAQAQAASAVRKQMALLPTEQKQILHLAFFEGLSHSQISSRTGLALGTVKSRIRTSLKKLQPRLEEYRGVDQ